MGAMTSPKPTPASSSCSVSSGSSTPSSQREQRNRPAATISSPATVSGLAPNRGSSHPPATDASGITPVIRNSHSAPVNGSFCITVSAVSGTVTIAKMSDTPTSACVRLDTMKAHERRNARASNGCQMRRSTSSQYPEQAPSPTRPARRGLATLR